MPDEVPTVDQSAAPPTSPVERLSSPRPSWPTVLGVIAICFASLGLLCSVPTSIISFISPLMFSLAPDDVFSAEMKQSMNMLYLFNGIISVIAIPVALWHLFAGIGLLKFKRAAIAGMRSSAWLIIAFALVYSIGTSVSQISFQQQMFQNMGQMTAPVSPSGQSPAPPPQPSSQTPPFVTTTTSVVVAVFGVVYFFTIAAWPIFALIWLARSTCRQHVQTHFVRRTAAT